jgi:hypothetical protein
MFSNSPFSRRRLLALTLPLAATVYASSALALDIIIDVAPPPVKVEVIQQRPGFIWAPGYWRWDGHTHVWVGGHLEKDRPGHHWIKAEWVEEHGRHRFVEGHWD